MNKGIENAHTIEDATPVESEVKPRFDNAEQAENPKNKFLDSIGKLQDKQRIEPESDLIKEVFDAEDKTSESHILNDGLAISDEKGYNQNSKGSFIEDLNDHILGVKPAYNAERFEAAGIKGAFDGVPRDRREAVYERFENAPEEIKSIVNELSSKLSVEDTENDDCCHYDLLTKTIRMESNMDDEEYSEVFSHEYGHFVDNIKGDVSNTVGFREAISSDLAIYDRNTKLGRQNFDNMMDELMNSDAAYDRAISDNLSAYFENDPEIVQRYWDEGVDYYQHANSYWAEDGNREAEIYANSFSMSAQDNKASCEFMKKHFPNTWNCFINTLQGGQK